MRIVFMGTPEFAVPSLIALHKEHQIAAVVTAPDKPAGRGRQLQQSDVKLAALDLGLPVLQPEKLKDNEFLNQLRELDAELFVVVAFRMLPEAVWNMPPRGTINLHGSLLPQYRGAAPINRAVMNGEKVTGLTTFFLQHEIDTGNIIAQKKATVGDDETAGELYQRLMHEGAILLTETVRMIESGSAPSIPQESIDSGAIKHAPKIFREDCRIDWTRSAREIHNHVRGLSPYPAAFSMLHVPGQPPCQVKIFRTSCSPGGANTPGLLQSTGKASLEVSTGDGTVSILELQLEGKKRLSASEFLRGFQVREGSYLA